MVVAFLGLRVPAAVVLTPWLGADAIYWAFPIGSFASVVMTTLYYRHGSWRRARMF
jgi:Na+-driven multidrug efflux pump